MASNRRAVWPGLAIAIGLLGGLPTCGYGALRWFGSGLGAVGCQSSGCDAAVQREADTGIGLMMLGVLAGGSLAALGIAVRRADAAGRRARAAALAQGLPEARVVARSPGTPPSES